MEFAQYNIEPTDENILDSFLQDVTGKNAVLYTFLEIIDHNSVSSIALNGDWGSGKTFFIKQAALLIEYISANPQLDIEVRQKLNMFFQSGEGSHSRHPKITRCRAVYYDAWLYDEHKDPIQSLLYFLSVTFNRNYGIQAPKATKIFSAAVKTLAKWKGADLDSLAESFLVEDASIQVRSLEDVKVSLQEAFHDLLGDNYTLVIFVDELDRCKPTYAVRFLEQIKHFFSCPKVKFVFATNLQQLGTSIQRFYGDEFQSTKYLNKFFDFTVELPPTSLPQKDYFRDFCIYLCSYFGFSLRDLNIFLRSMDKLGEKVIKQVESYSEKSSSQPFSYLFFPPIFVALSIVSRSEYMQVVSGKDTDIILDIFSKWPDGIEFAKMTLPRVSESDDTDIQKMVSKLYSEIFNNFSNLNSQKSVILKLASLLY